MIFIQLVTFQTLSDPGFSDSLTFQLNQVFEEKQTSRKCFDLPISCHGEGLSTSKSSSHQTNIVLMSASFRQTSSSKCVYL